MSRLQASGRRSWTRCATPCAHRPSPYSARRDRRAGDRTRPPKKVILARPPRRVDRERRPAGRERTSAPRRQAQPAAAIPHLSQTECRRLLAPAGREPPRA
eukprot:5369965-Prymnesium_polylepis.3